MTGRVTNGEGLMSEAVQFYDYPDSWQIAKKLGLVGGMGLTSREEMYDTLDELNLAAGNGIGVRHSWFERAWRKAGCPYYDVYPAIIPMLTSISLDIPGEHIKPPQGYDSLLLRLPKNREGIEQDGLVVRSVFFSFQLCNRAPGMDAPEQGLCVGMDLGERDVTGIPVFTLRAFPLDERPIEEAMRGFRDHESLREGLQVPIELIERCVRLALTVCLIGEDDELLDPEILAKDRAKYRFADEEKRRALIEKARRRGKHGYRLGAKLEVIPHVRRPHPALYWTGKGRSVPVIRMRKGAIVHRSKLSSIPTGRMEGSGDG